MAERILVPLDKSQTAEDVLASVDAAPGP